MCCAGCTTIAMKNWHSRGRPFILSRHHEAGCFARWEMGGVYVDAVRTGASLAAKPCRRPRDAVDWRELQQLISNLGTGLEIHRVCERLRSRLRFARAVSRPLAVVLHGHRLAPRLVPA